jgi:O-antigen/teichoic acid export membrane protein
VQRLSVIAFLFQAFIITLWPAYAEAIARGEYAWARRAFWNSLFVTLAISMVLAIVLAVFGQVFITFWVGSSVRPSPGLIYGFCFYMILTAFVGSIASILNSGPQLRQQVRILAAASLLSLGMKFALCLQYGSAGVIWATVIGYGVLYVIPGLAMVRNLFQRNDNPQEANAIC